MENKMIPCRGCGKEIHRTAATCPHCGAQLRIKRYKRKATASVLAIFLGGLGIHRFYLGQWWGIFYLLFFLCLAPFLVIFTLLLSIASFFEGMSFLFTNDEKWDEKFNEGIPGKGEGTAGLVVAIVAGPIFFVVMVSVLAAMSIPSYQDYVIRARVKEVMVTGDKVKQLVEQYVHNKRSWPSKNSDVALPDRVNEKYIEALSVSSGGTITIRLSRNSGLAAGETIVISPLIDSDKLIWSCVGGTLEKKYRPEECRK